MKKLTVKERKALATTKGADLLKVFKGHTREQLRIWRREARLEFPGISMDADAHDRRQRERESFNKKERQALLEDRERLSKELGALRKLLGSKGYRDLRVQPKSKKEESAVIALASDWHCEELVTADETNGLNFYDLSVFDKRSDMYFHNLAKLVKKEQHDTPIRTGVLWLGGDLISGNIHEELMETNQLGPVKAAIRVQKSIAGGIKYLLENTDLTWQIPCSVGNHERITKKRRIKTSIENSLATYIYYALALQFEGEKRLTFRLPTAYHTYVDVMGYTCRFHHGDAVRFGGGVGGLTIPLKKKIGRWNTSRRADYDFLGHFHQFLDGGSFIVNGSLIGYSSYAVEIAAEFEAPKQAFTLINSRHGKTGVFPILLEP